MAGRVKKKGSSPKARPAPAVRTNWSKVRAPGKGDVDRKLYERSATFKRRQAAAEKGQRTRASKLSIDLEAEWTELKRLKAMGRGDLAKKRYGKKFRKIEQKLRQTGRKIYVATMSRVNRDVGGARGAWRDYGRRGVAS